MPVPPLDDRALEALLSGSRAPQSGFDWLLPFVEGLEEASSGPAPAAKPALATLLARGLSAEEGDLPATAAGRVTTPAPQAVAPPKWRKIAGLGIAAKVGMGLTLAAATTTAAGAAGVLPAPAQHAVARVVDVATPFTFPDQPGDKAEVGARVSADGTGASDGVAGLAGRVVREGVDDTRAGETSIPAPTGTHAATDAGTGTDAGNGTRAPAGKAAGVGANTGTTGLARANETPAAGRAPTSVPAGTGAPVARGSQGSKGLDTAKRTPAAGRVPPRVPPKTTAPPNAGPPGSKGRDASGRTPAAGRTSGGSAGRP